MNSRRQQIYQLTRRKGEWVLTDSIDRRQTPVDQVFLQNVTPFLPGIVGGPQAYVISAIVDSGSESSEVLEALWLEREPLTGLAFNRSRIDEGSSVIVDWCATLPLRGALTRLKQGTAQLLAADGRHVTTVRGEPLEVLFAIVNQVEMPGPFKIFARALSEQESDPVLDEVVVLLPQVAWHYRS